MEDGVAQPMPSRDRNLRFALLFFIVWMVVVVLPRFDASSALVRGDVLLMLPPISAVVALFVTLQRARVFLQLVVVPVLLIVAASLRVPMEAPSSLPGVILAALALISYWLWVLEHEAKQLPLRLQTEPIQRAGLLPPATRWSWRSLVLHAVATLAVVVAFVSPTSFAGIERRTFVLTMAAAFVIMAAIGGVAPMLRLEKRRADRKEVGRRALVMFFYAAACLAILWLYLEYRRV